MRKSVVALVAIVSPLAIVQSLRANSIAINQSIVANIQAVNNTDSSLIYKVAPMNGTNTISDTYIEDPVTRAQYAAGGYGADPNGPGGTEGVGTGTVVVQNYTDAHSNTRNGAIVMTTSEGPTDGALYFDTGPNPLMAAHDITLSFSVDLAQNGGVNSPADIDGAAFASNIFAEGSSATRFIAAPTGANGGVFGLTKADGSLQTVTTYNNNTFYDISLDLNFDTQQVTMSVDGNSFGPFAFRNVIAAAPGFDAPRLTEAFFYENTYATAVPLPKAAYAGLGLIAGLMLLGAAKRRRRLIGSEPQI